MSSQSGFSLIELLIALAVIIIVLMFAIPNEKSFIVKSHDDVMSQQLLRAIYLARNEALARGTSVTLCPSENTKTCGTQWLQGYLILANEKVISVYQNTTQRGRIYWRSFPKGRDSLTFLASGIAEIENGTFWYCLDETDRPHWAIMMSRSGRARLVLPNAEGEIINASGETLNCT